MHDATLGVDKHQATCRDNQQSCESKSWTIVYDSRCPVVRQLAHIVKKWDKKSFFRFIKYDSTASEVRPLVAQLEASPWSLLLIDDLNNSFTGPEAIPFILTNLPFGRIAAVAYIIPGTLWLTHQLYYLVSKNRHLFSKKQKPVLKHVRPSRSYK